MAAGSPAPDLFEALAWSERVAPPVDDTAASAPPPVDLPPPVELPAPEPAAALTSAGLDRPVVRPRTPPALPKPAAPPPPPSSSFGGLADALEPEADVSPPLDEFEGLLDIFGDSAAAPVASPRSSPTLPAPAKPALPVTPAARVVPSPRRPTPVHAPVTRRPTPVIGTLPRAKAELGPSAVSTSRAIDFPSPGDPAVSAQLASVAEPSSPMVSRVAPRADIVVDDEPRSRSGMPFVWVALTLMLGGALAYVVATQTDLLKGNVIELRNAEAQEQAEAEHAAAEAKQEATKVEYGTIELDSTPKGARVFAVQAGPEARFDHLPLDHEYMVAVTAPGHVSRVRMVKGTELEAPVILDLDPLAAGATAAPLAEERPPKLAQAPGKTTTTLVLRSNTPGAQLGLLVGYTPGVKIIDVDVEQTHRFHVVLAGHETAEVIVKGRHFEELGSSGGLAFQDTIALVPAVAVPAGVAPADDEATDDEADDVVVVDDAAAAAAAPAPAAKLAAKAPTKKKQKKKKKKKR